ncbi:MAG: anthranilate phosphoribosyltransferase [Candidatus Aminicenantes bacterium]|nr:anthranilate phosphoribosyltransferase [Candidatus Aminicenantes bacterium]
MIEQAIRTLCEGYDLDLSVAEASVMEIMEGKATPAQVSAFLIGLRMKGETPEEIFSFVKTLREKALKIELSQEEVVDLCGTGGDGKSTFNISTISAFVVAGAGVKVAKHGNRAISSQCGSADLIEGLGVKLPDSPSKVRQSVEELGIGFIFAPYFHPSMKNVQPIRKEIGVRTIFNLLGPLINPAGVKRQLIGFFNEKVIKKVAEVIRKLGGERYLLVHSMDGLDEISVAAPTAGYLVERNELKEIEIVPEDYGIRMREASIKALSLQENLNILFSVLRGEDSVYRDFVLINAGAAIFVSGKAPDLKEGIEMAKDSIDSGKARQKLKDFIKFHQED